MAIFPEEFGGTSTGDIPFDVLVPALIILGIHGTLTISAEVGIFRKFLCYMAGVPGGVFAFNIVGQILGL